MDSGVIYHKLNPPQELANPVEGQPLSVALQYFFDHTGFSGELLKVLQYAMSLALRYEGEQGQIVAEATPPIEARPRRLPTAERTAQDPNALNLPRGINPFGVHDGMTTTTRLFHPSPDHSGMLVPRAEKNTFPANPDPNFDPNAPIIHVESGENATDPALAMEIERQNKISPAERFKLKEPVSQSQLDGTGPEPVSESQLGQQPVAAITSEPDDVF